MKMKRRDHLTRFASARNGLAGGPAANSWYALEGADEEVADLVIYDEIAWWAFSAEDFAKELLGVTAGEIRVHLNTPGGFVSDGMAIYSTLKQHPARVVVYIEGLAASMGSVIALAGDEVRIAKTGFVMIHDPWTIVLGSAQDLRKEAAILDKIGKTMAEVYMEKTGLGLEEVQALMAEETWWTGAEAVEIGFADRLIELEEEEQDQSAANLARFDLNIFSKAPKRLLDLARSAPQSGKPDGPPSKRQTEKKLREAGFSRSQAVAILANGYENAFSQREAGDESGFKDLAALLRSNINAMRAGR